MYPHSVYEQKMRNLNFSMEKLSLSFPIKKTTVYCIFDFCNEQYFRCLEKCQSCVIYPVGSDKCFDSSGQLYTKIQIRCVENHS